MSEEHSFKIHGVTQDGKMLISADEAQTLISRELAIAGEEIEQLKKENEEAFKKGFWAGFEDARCFPEETNILNRYNKLKKENK